MIPFKFFNHYNLGDIQPLVSNTWRTARGIRIEINNLDTIHIRNILSCLRGTGEKTIPNPYDGKTHDEWYTILTNELTFRQS